MANQSDGTGSDTSRLGRNSDDPLFWEPSLSYIRGACVGLLLGSLIYAGVICWLTPEQTLRLASVLAIVLVALVSGILILRGRLKAAAYTMVFGVWAGITISVGLFGGVRAPSVYSYPLSIIFVGWLIGPRAALAMGGLTVLVIACFVVGESAGILPAQPPTPALMHGVIQALVVTLATALIIYLVHSYGTRTTELRRLGATLSSRTAELELRTRDLQRAQAVAKTGSWIADYVAGTVHLSDEACRIFGVPEGTPGNFGKFLSRLDPADQSLAERARASALKSGAGLEPHELRLIVQGETRWIRLTAEHQLDTEGKVVRAIGTVQDITEQKTVEIALRESEQRYRTLLDWTPEAVAVHREGLVVYVNPAAVAMMGARSAHELMGRRILDSVHPDYREVVLARMKQAGERGEATPLLEEKFIRLDGSPIDVEVQTTPIVYDGRRAIHVAMRDITARKQVERALRNSEELFSKAFQASPMLISITTLAEGRYLNVNDAFLRLLGYAREEVVGRTSADLGIWKRPEDRARAIEGLSGAGAGTGTEVELRKKSGATVMCEVRGAPIDVDGVPSLIMVTSDITERKAAEAARSSLEAQLRESQKMEAIGTLAGGIAHDFNNIIATILGNAELARQDAGTNAPVLESLEEIRKSGVRARELVQQILSFSRREPTRRASLLLPPLVQESARLLRATLPARVTLEVHCDTQVPAVLADATQLQQVLINLTTNAMQAMRGRPGRIALHLDSVMLDAAMAEAHPALRELYTHHPGATVRLAVRDDGEGMDPETLGHVFEPFFTTKPVGEGTGLGLSVVLGIVQTHEGAITVQSQAGAGTTFTVYLPAAPASASAPPPAAAALASPAHVPPPRASRHILYVDDDASLLFLVKRLLERHGFRVSAFSNQMSALDALRADAAGCDLVLTDYNMPGLSGLDVAREVRSIRADLPVVVASGFIDDGLRSQAAAAGVRDLLFKPAAVEDFCSAIQALLGQPDA